MMYTNKRKVVSAMCEKLSVLKTLQAITRDASTAVLFSYAVEIVSC